MCVFSSHSRIFHSFGDITIAGEGLQILTYARHLWPLNNEGSFACHTYCDMGHPFITGISEDPWHSHRAFGSGSVTTGSKALDLWRLGFEHPTFRLRDERSKPLHHCRSSPPLWLRYCRYGVKPFLINIILTYLQYTSVMPVTYATFSMVYFVLKYYFIT